MCEILPVKVTGSSSNLDLQSVLPFAVQLWKARNLNINIKMVPKAPFDLQETEYLALCL